MLSLSIHILYMMYFFLQMFIRVMDRARPSNYAETTLFITVIRNLNPPRFTNPDFPPSPQPQTLELTILETVGIGKLVYHLNATDDDGVGGCWLAEH